MYIREVRQCGKNRVADIRHFFKAAKIHPVFRKNRKKILPHRWEVSVSKKPFSPHCSALSMGVLHREL